MLHNDKFVMSLILFVWFCAISSVEMMENNNVDTQEEILRKNKKEKIKPSFEIHGNPQRVEKVLVRNENEKT